MYKRLNCFASWALLIGLCAVTAFGAIPIEVENYSFEDPAIAKIIGWDMEDGAHYQTFDGGAPADVPGWESDGDIADSGVETGFITTGADGDWTGFIMAQDPSVYNLTNFLIGSGDVYTLEVDARNNWEATNFELSLYYDDNGTRVIVDANTVTVEDPMTTYSVIFVADNLPAAYDHEIGIELDNVSDDLTSWIGMDNVRLTLTSPLYRAYQPYPAHKGGYEGTQVDLTWIPGPNLPSADNFHVYISTDRDEVDSDHPNADMGLVDDPNYLFTDLAQGPTYYWRIDTMSGATIYRGSTWSFKTKSIIGYSPDPRTETDYVPVDPLLSWEPGTGAVEGHVVIFGDNFSEVNDAPIGTTGGGPPYRLYLTDVTDTNCTPMETGHPDLEVNTMYYWRVDTVEADPGTIHKGTVWNFLTVPVAGLGSITREVWMGITGDSIADLTDDENYPDTPTTANYPTSFDAPRRWDVDYGTRMHGWLYVETTGDYTFWIAAENNGELWLENDIIATASAPGYHAWGTAPEQQSEPIHLEAGNLYYIMALQKQGNDNEDYLGVAWSDTDDVDTAEIIPGKYLLPFHLFARVKANTPGPANHATDVREDPLIVWNAGKYAASHRIYLGTDLDEVANADMATAGIYRGTQTLDQTTFDPGVLDWSTEYFWRVDEVNDLHPEALWTGDIWSFTIGAYKLVDDFEAYQNTGVPGANRVFETWNDGIGFTNPDGSYNQGNGTNMIVGVDDAPYGPERGIVYSGLQSLPLTFDNSGDPYYSETDRTFDEPQNWTMHNGHDLNILGIQVRGRWASPNGFTSDGSTYTVVGSGTDIWNESDEFHYVYIPLTGNGSIVVRVDSIEDVDISAKAGVMIRDTLAPDSANAMINVTPDNLLEWITREFAGVASESVVTDTDSIALPHWLRLSREGNILTGEHSTDGQTWEFVGNNSSISIVMTDEVYIGMAVTSRVDANTPCEAVFSNVQLTGTASATLATSVDIGLPINDAADLYVAIEDATGAVQAVYPHKDNPNAILIQDWVEWLIPLSTFADQGVDLTQVKKMIVGVGDKQPGGEGKLYIDDARLYEE